MRKRDLLALLREARDLLDHDAGSHVRRADDTYAPCAACDLEERIDAAVHIDGYSQDGDL